MDEEVKNTLATNLAEKLRAQAADFGLETGDPDQIATNIVDDFARYAKFRETGDWEKDEKYKWDFIKNRFKNEKLEPIPYYLCPAHQ